MGEYLSIGSFICIYFLINIESSVRAANFVFTGISLMQLLLHKPHNDTLADK